MPQVDIIVFVAALSEYNQVLAEDSSKNRMLEALDLFEQIVNSHHFQDIQVLVSRCGRGRGARRRPHHVLLS